MTKRGRCDGFLHPSRVLIFLGGFVPGSLTTGLMSLIPLGSDWLVVRDVPGSTTTGLMSLIPLGSIVGLTTAAGTRG